MDLSIIRNLSEKRVGGMRKLASDIGMSEANLHRCVNNNKIQAADLEQIAKLLKVDVRLFFDELPVINKVDIHGDYSPVSMNGDVSVSHISPSNIDKVTHLEELLKEKERLISVLLSDRDK